MIPAETVKKMMELSSSELAEALHRNGYEDDEVSSSKFMGMAQPVRPYSRMNFMYWISYHDGMGETSSEGTATIYVGVTDKLEFIADYG